MKYWSWIVASIGLLLIMASAFAHPDTPNPLFQDYPPNQRQDIMNWFGSDMTIRGCCGEGDAFLADEFETKGDDIIAIITNGRGFVPEGKTYRITPEIIAKTRGLRNPTKHGIVFLHTGYINGKVVGFRCGQANAPFGGACYEVEVPDADVLCYFPPAGY